ncbi:hypothetical protein ABIE44_003227 [Marmoricola sp. OAE513]|uniref:phospholipase D-like domain-containing protein n=1 Tax=Marmoricola sp. OAE513 TaxID=2817894 RepID=UPI001AE23F5E
MARRSTRWTALAATFALAAGVGFAAVSSNGSASAAGVAPMADIVPKGGKVTSKGNPLCPVIPPTSTPTPTPGVTPAPQPVVHQKNCILPYLKGWRPKLGPVFNNPLGSKAAAQANIRRVVNAINHAPKRSYIRIAVYSFDRSEVAYALRKAKKRGVRIQVVVNGAVMSGVTRGLQKYLGSNPKKSSFVISCSGACRSKGPGGNLHDKVFAFSRTGGARGLLIIGSGNLTSKATYRQWNDSNAISQDTALYGAWIQMFTQIKNRKRVGPRRISYAATSGAYGAQFSKIMGVSRSTTKVVAIKKTGRYKASSDRVVKRLKRVTCAAPKGYGSNGRTLIRITMYAMFKARGEAIAREIARLKRNGCNIMMIMSVPGGKTARILSKAGIPLRSADWLFTERDPLVEDGIGGYGPRFYSHYKVMALSGMYNGKPTDTVWTGSENWDALSFANEEVVIQLNNRDTFQKYYGQFKYMWNSRVTHRMGIQPLYGP